jgi:hypothetical protein
LVDLKRHKYEADAVRAAMAVSQDIAVDGKSKKIKRGVEKYSE